MGFAGLTRVPNSLTAAFGGLLLTVGAAIAGHSATAADSFWPDITREQRPWAYWWWMGSAVDPTNLTRELTRYHEAGYGGVHIIPIYGAKGWESNYIRYLSPRWMEMLDHTVREAKRLDLGVDMTTGTGWCFGGGPDVTDREGNANVVVKTFDLAGGGRLTNKFDPNKLQALVAFPAQGQPVEITKSLRADGLVDWVAPAGAWKVYAVSQKPSSQKVKRASPGGEGPMLNLLYPEAMPVFLRRFTEAFGGYHGLKPRAQYHDSYEYKTDWAPDFFKQFARRRGYRLEAELPSLFTFKDERAMRVLADYRETVSDLMVEDSLPQWVKWSHQRGFITRNEAHGSPGNLLDLYALADVPETEMFRLDRNKLISKFASSAAHVAGHKLTGAETGTWLKEHFTETLADMKYLVDDLFLSGVNHVFYHGTCYSPDEAPWPGWVFYASYEMNPRNAVWHDVRALNDYVTRCQSILQAGKPDNDILLYWPLHDFWQKAGAEPFLPHLTVHARAWFESQPIGALAEQLWQRGYQFDYVSDRQLAQAKAARSGIKVPGGTYRTVVVPRCDFIPLATLEKLVSLAKSGGCVIFADALPADVPGLGNLEKRRASFQELRTQASAGRVGKGQVIVGAVEAALSAAGVSREAMVDNQGLMCIRRASAQGRDYFIANRGTQPFHGWLPVAFPAKTMVLLDPMSRRAGEAVMTSTATNDSEVYLQLEPGASMILRAFSRDVAVTDSWPYITCAEPAVAISGTWRVRFLQGGPVVPGDFTTNSPLSWTLNPDSRAQAFAGSAVYSVNFDAGAKSKFRCMLDLGGVVQSARVWVNGKSYGTLFTSPFRVVVDNLKPVGNRLEVEVTSTSANRIRDLDQRGVKWQNFYDINFVNQDYKTFNASQWPVAAAGLLGPVTLMPVVNFNP